MMVLRMRRTSMAFAMFALALNGAKCAASNPSTRAAFSILPSSTTFDARCTRSKTHRLSSTCAELENMNDRASLGGGDSLHTVVVKRNRQSAAFREGTPLIFGGSVAATYTEHCRGGEAGATSGDGAISIGSLVAVAVGRDPPAKEKGKKVSQSGKRNGSSPSNKRGDSVVAPHYNFSADDLEATHRESIRASQLIGFGTYNPESMYRVRILCHETMHPGLSKEIRAIRKQSQGGSSHTRTNGAILRLILERKISDAIYTRLAMKLPSAGVTDTYRLVNGEGDGLSGLAVDILGGSTAIVMSSAAWCEIHRDMIVEVLEASLASHPSYVDTDIDIVWRNTPSRLKQDGYEITLNPSDDEKDATPVIATESSVKYYTFPYSDGQKTGFYADQRENRLMMAELCNNKRVLDLCCYNGGFALNAMIRGGASSAVGVDSSQDAVDAATENAKLNGLAEENVSFVRDDISNFMKVAIDSNDEYDVIILDPPKLAPSISALDKAKRKYHALNRDAMNLIDRDHGGLLLTCTCSAAMTQKDGGQYFLDMVNGAAMSARRRVTLLRVSGAAPCHTQSPASFPAGAYLTAALFHVGPAADSQS